MHNDFIHFLMNHWELSLAFILILAYWIVSEIIEWQSTLGITPSHAVHLMNREGGVVVDLREAALFEKSHIIGSLNIPEKTLFDNLSGLKKHASKPVILVDVQGAHSNKIINKFIAQGFEKAHYLKGGIHAWIQEKLPLESHMKDQNVKKGNK